MRHILLIMLTLSLLFIGCGADTDLDKAKKILKYQSTEYDNHEATGELINGVRVIEIKAWQFYFEPSLIVVNQGEKLKLIVSAEDIPHGFEIHGVDMAPYDINTIIRKGQPATIEFVAKDPGVFEFICAIYCGYGHSKMKGTFVVR